MVVEQKYDYAGAMEGDRAGRTGRIEDDHPGGMKSDRTGGRENDQGEEK